MISAVASAIDPGYIIKEHYLNPHDMVAILQIGRD